LKTCANCGNELGDEAGFCHVCGASQTTGGGRSASNKNLIIPRTFFYAIMIALALMGLAVVGLVVRGPTVITQTQNNYVTQTQFATYTANFFTTSTETQAYTVTAGSFTTLSGGPPPAWFSGQYCGYPFNPYLCNEGAPVTINGYLTADGTCVDLSLVGGQTYVVWNLNGYPANSTYASWVATQPYINKGVQVYGFVYPNWPPTQPFPPYPFQTSICVGIPIWSIAPYIQTF
jgi:hypothetical protein